MVDIEDDHENMLVMTTSMTMSVWKWCTVTLWSLTKADNLEHYVHDKRALVVQVVDVPSDTNRKIPTK
eukprot:5148493-Amphidinium_carterae.1